jgi:predicted RNA-binding protein with RPS1 domain
MPPGDFADVHEAFQAIEGDEQTELHESAHKAFFHISDLQVLESLCALFAHCFALRNDDLARFLVHRDDFDGEGMADELLEPGDDFHGIGIVHISEIAWGHVKNPSEFAQVGDRVTVKVIGVDGEKLSLSIKQMTKDPWEEVAERYPVGKKVSGTVVRFTEYGAFLKLEKDLSGLVHLSEIAHEKVTDPAQVLTIGQKVEAQVINIDVDERRIGLSVKALKPIDKETMERIKREREEEEAKATKGTEGTEETKGDEASSSGFVASKTGKKYYAADSAAGKKITDEHRVHFATAEEAEAAGYSA